MDKDYLLKAIAYKARHRGSKECDLIITTFVETYTQKHHDDASALALLLAFIDRDDLSVFKAPEMSPAEFQSISRELFMHQKHLRGGMRPS